MSVQRTICAIAARIAKRRGIESIKVTAMDALGEAQWKGFRIAVESSFGKYWRVYRFPYDIRQMSSPPSSEVNNEPSAANATPTMRPYTSFLAGSGTNLVKNGCGSPAGEPL